MRINAADRPTPYHQRATDLRFAVLCHSVSRAEPRETRQAKATGDTDLQASPP